MNESDLTIVLTVKGRHLHTLRWLWHANRIRLPFHVIVADGEVHPTIERLLSNSAMFPNLSFEYHRYADHSVEDFYFKVVDTLERTRTPYVMRSDNDDFLLPFGIRKSMAFLDCAPEYVCAGGGIPGFSIDRGLQGIPDVTGLLQRVAYRYISNEWYQCRDIDSPSASGRVLEEVRIPLAVHYYIYRTPALHALVSEIRESNPSFQLCEMYSSLRTMTSGKVRSDPSCFIYLRQRGTSQFLAYSNDLVDDLIRSSLSEDFRAMASKIATDATHSDGGDPTEIREYIHDAYTEQVRRVLASSMLRYRYPRLFALKQRIRALPRPRLVPRTLRCNLDKRKLWKSLAADGADRNTIAAHAAELEDVFATLQGDGFSEFLSRNAPELLSIV